MFESVLIANRGEIACRVARTARRLGMRVIAVYSEADAHALHVRMADEAYLIGPPPARESYLDGGRILEVARECGAQCIHPGYGFLSENAGFAEACATAGIAFVGPPPAAIRAMGLKDAAKTLMAGAGVRVVPGYQGEAQDPVRLRREADAVGYPVLIKAVAGGGGKGMRRVDRAADFADALLSCRREAASAFGDERVLVEKYVSAPRHIEVQVFADMHGGCVYLFERDCSLQRRHQKVIEEAPAPGIPSDMRMAMGEAAVAAARAVDYVGAGTVEFIADSSDGLRADAFYFMEMNTRLQVEHPVTEMVTGLDLVELQFRAAAGERLPFTQADIGLDGHSVEARLYAEDPAAGFLPQAGRLQVLRWPRDRENLRIETGVEQGAEISPWYDPMIAKLVAWGPTRNAALHRLKRALDETVVLGLRTNAAFLRRLITQPDFVEARVDTGLIDRHLVSLVDASLPAATVALCVEAWLKLLEARQASPDWRLTDEPRSPWDQVNGWRLLGSPRTDRLVLDINGGEADIRVVWQAGEHELHIRFGAMASVIEAGAVAFDGSRLEAVVDGRHMVATVAFSPGLDRLWLASHAGHVEVAEHDLLNRNEEAGAGGASLRAPMSGKVIQVLASEGARVAKGDRLLVLEAMKMEHALVAGFDGVVERLGAVEGEQVEEGRVLVVLAEPGGQP